ncbi:Hypothetical protein AKI40_0268 [Enterobacter sp. FY-07]|uniref:DUF7660 family protein n=1 Tax=Kosakonia oryzendophytica TaxID=1005665 RepID=UPI0007777CE7|nr:hypothetical protein [Kosakonia oryzendophytica]AMO46696.1 Hypothetical protein AKI40_0268 [Enterobacter sp. FY-07]WBT58470.1 hypothetical protein O9K67_01330 [Kosakonia oryzendophytica]
MCEEYFPVNNREELLTLIQALATDARHSPEAWQNKSVADYLEAMASWIEDMDGYYKNRQLPLPQNISWGVFADVLMAAKSYE